jgi:hypothetical protein
MMGMQRMVLCLNFCPPSTVGSPSTEGSNLKIGNSKYFKKTLGKTIKIQDNP